MVSLITYRLPLRSVLQLCGFQKLKISLPEFFVCKNATTVHYFEAALRVFYYCFLQVSLFVDVYKKKSDPKEFVVDPPFGRDPYAENHGFRLNNTAYY